MALKYMYLYNCHTELVRACTSLHLSLVVTYNLNVKNFNTEKLLGAFLFRFDVKIYVIKLVKQWICSSLSISNSRYNLKNLEQNLNFDNIFGPISISLLRK